MLQKLRWVIGTIFIQSVLVGLLAWLLPGFTVGGLGSSIIAALAISTTLAIAWPVIYRFSARFHPLLFPLLTFLLTGLAVFIVGQVDIGLFDIDDLWTGIIVTLGLTIGNVFVGALFSLQNTEGYHWFVVRPLSRSHASTPKTLEPGVLFLEIDGLAEPILRQAIAEGYMPTLKRWLDDDTHRLLGWEPDLSSQTSASQAGILLGDNTDIPAFRWYDKPAGKLMVTSKLATTSEVEHRLSTGQGLLADGGASRWNIFSGDAPDCLCTYSAVGDKKRGISRGYVAYFTNPYTFARTLALFVGDVVRERWQARSQERRDETPRIHRQFKYALVRAGTTTVMQEASQFMLISDMFRGVPVVYNTFFAYDEVAHHSGIDRTDALKVLRTIDSVFATFERAAELAPRPYRFVVLSDHGQSMGATFRQRYDQSLSDLVESLVSPDQEVEGFETTTEDTGNVNLALTEATRQGGKVAGLVKRTTKGHSTGEEVDIGSPEEQAELANAATAAAANVVVLASGNLGLISFPGWKERMTYEQLVEAYPDLLPGLVGHEGIGFAMVHSAQDGGLVIGKDGMHYLVTGRIVGTDPLALFGPNAATHLSRTDSFGNAPDILLNSFYDPATGEVAAFEELVGNHGGLGGTQTQPFVLHPAEFAAPDQPIVGAAALHAVLKGWRAEANGNQPSVIAD